MELQLGIVLLWLRYASCIDEALVDYYVNLMTNVTARARTSSLPQDASEYRPLTHDIADYGTFDYIIVGAGSAGSVIANRLTEVPDHQVLLIEAGGPESPFTDIPAMIFFLQGTEYNWNYNTTPQDHACLGMTNRQCPFPRGKALGGTSAINGLMYVRGNKVDYDLWYGQGNPGWSYEEVLPYFKKSEKSHVDGDEHYHGKHGYLDVEYHQPLSPQLGAFIAANAELGYQEVDYNGKQQLGVSPIQYTTRNGRRESAAKAFLAPAVKRPNLTILTRSYVTKILVEEATNTAYGVLFSSGGNQFTATARKEVVVSAGVIGSPQLLMLSGIGPADHLLSLGIPVIRDLPVGNNFQDHPAFLGLHFETSYVEPVESREEYVRQFFKGYGPLTLAGNVQGIGFYQTRNHVPGYPDIEIIIVAANNTNGYAQRGFHLTDETNANLYAKIDPVRSFTFYLLIMHPKSRGFIRLRSKDPYDYPLIDPAFLSDVNGEDIETLYEGVQLALKLINTKAFQSLNATLVPSTIPACRHLEYFSKEFWYCQLRQLTASLYHPVGSCRMGPDPSEAVVNHELRVHGVNRLRVADASIMPTLISGHINAPAIMIGEKAADMIKHSS